MNYRREIDGLRALAVLPVVFFHAGFEPFSGGYVGVDVFFVISGYLITAIMLAQLTQGKLSTLDFYERRARRILPALFVVVFSCLPFAWLLLPPTELTSFSKSVAAVPLFISNIFFCLDGGYFETAAELKPLLHTWSLAVEEQYYLIFPILIIYAWRRGRKFIFRSILAVAILSLALAQLGSTWMPAPTYFLLPTRAWELAIGALIALSSSQASGQTLPTKIRQGLALLGLALLLLAIFGFNSETPFPSVYALIPTLGTALIIIFADRNTFVGHLLSTRIMVGIGLISYSIYLWHQPVFAFARHLVPGQSLAVSAALIALVLVLSVLSWKFIETPFRDRTVFNRRWVFSSSATAGVALVLFGYLSSKIHFSNEDAMAKALTESAAIYSSNMDERSFIRARIMHETLSPDIIVLGSSRIMQVGKHIIGAEILNLSVSGSSVEDDMAIWYMATKKFTPDTLLIGADPWLFNLKSGQERWKMLAPEYQLALYELGLSDTAVADEISTPSPPNALMNAGARLYSAINFSKIEAEDDTPSVQHKIRRDGSRVYSLSFSNKSLSTVERGATGFAAYAMSPYEFSQTDYKRFEAFILGAAQRGQVVLVLSPYHPKLYGFMRSQRPEFIAIEQQFRDLADKHGLRIIGSYDPSKAGCGTDEFFDGMHPKDSCMKKVMSEAFGAPHTTHGGRLSTDQP